jgi:hypothetical protein
MVEIQTTIKRRLRINGSDKEDLAFAGLRRQQQEDQKLSYHLQADEKQKDKNRRQGHEQKPQSKQPENKKQQQKVRLSDKSNQSVLFFHCMHLSGNCSTHKCVSLSLHSRVLMLYRLTSLVFT